MTNAEAIEILKSRRMCAAYVDSEYVDSVDIEAIDMAISALEKQESGWNNHKVEVKHGSWQERIVDDDELDKYGFFRRRFYCSACGDWNTHGASKYCPNCGAKMTEV